MTTDLTDNEICLPNARDAYTESTYNRDTLQLQMMTTLSVLLEQIKSYAVCLIKMEIKNGKFECDLCAPSPLHQYRTLPYRLQMYLKNLPSFRMELATWFKNSGYAVDIYCTDKTEDTKFIVSWDTTPYENKD